ncbi:MAG: hypothetical protein HY319_00890 [Armatimonadetes bacterium]|nr:hypothetical protein [Armatimonadota bacterium]
MDKSTIIVSILGLGVFLWFFPELLGLVFTLAVLAAAKFILFDSALMVPTEHHAAEESLYGHLWRAPERR